MPYIWNRDSISFFQLTLFATLISYLATPPTLVRCCSAHVALTSIGLHIWRPRHLFLLIQLSSLLSYFAGATDNECQKTKSLASLSLS